MIEGTLQEVVLADELGVAWQPFLDRSKCGRKPIIATDSYKAQIICDSMESGLSCMMTWKIVNTHRKDEGLPSITISAVYNCIKRMRPKIIPIVAEKQGCSDPNDNTCMARFEWCLQLGIRLNLYKDENEVRLILLKKGYIATLDSPLPPAFDCKKLTKLSIDQFATWDETHKKIVTGSKAIRTMDRAYRFPRDENGKLDLVNGRYSEEKVTIHKCKYTDEVCLCLGVAVVTLVDENGLELPMEGRQLKPFSYSGKVLLSIPDYEKKLMPKFFV